MKSTLSYANICFRLHRIIIGCALSNDAHNTVGTGESTGGKLPPVGNGEFQLVANCHHLKLRGKIGMYCNKPVVRANNLYFGGINVLNLIEWHFSVQDGMYFDKRNETQSHIVFSSNIVTDGSVNYAILKNGISLKDEIEIIER
ncbi:MAG: hypothetical protein FWC71_08125, partial [Defluviitaleaceae bacterium]|nr:hypothetical protein [Defluviitaleaceae bacterium]